MSEKRNMEAAKRFFKRAVEVWAMFGDRVTTDGHTSYPRAIRETLGSDGQHRTNKYLKHRLEQDHRGTKERYYPMRGFGAIEATVHFCCDFDELCNSFRPRRTMGERVALAEQRRAFLQRLFTLKAKLQAAS